MNLQIFYPQWNYEFKFRVWQADSILIQGPDSHFPKNTIYMSQETCKVRNIIWANPARKRRTKSNILAETISIILADFYKLRTMKKFNSLGEMFQWICNMFFIEEKYVPWMQPVQHQLKQFSFFPNQFYSMLDGSQFTKGPKLHPHLNPTIYKLFIFRICDF